MEGLELASKVSTKEAYTVGDSHSDYKVAVLDLGCKRNILDNFADRGCYLKVFPAQTSYEELKAFNPDGFDVTALHEALSTNGPGMVAEFAEEELPGWRILGADVDVLFAGSKMGLINHQGAENVKAKLIAPTGPIPYTTKGALVLEKQGTTVLPDIVTTAGAMFGGMPPGEDDQDSIEHAIAELLSTLTGQIVGQDNMAILEACHRAEAFLRTWRDQLPFGRPFAA